MAKTSNRNAHAATPLALWICYPTAFGSELFAILREWRRQRPWAPHCHRND